MTEPDTTGPVRPLPDPHGPEKPPKANDVRRAFDQITATTAAAAAIVAAGYQALTDALNVALTAAAPETAPESPQTDEQTQVRGESHTKPQTGSDGPLTPAWCRTQLQRLYIAASESGLRWRDYDVVGAVIAENARLRSQLAEAREQRDQAAEALVQAETERDEARDRLRTLIDEVDRHAGAQCACDTNGECLARLYQQAHALVATAPETAPESPQTDEPAPEQAEASTGTQQPPEAVYCRECGASMRAASRMALCPDCHAPLCSPACLDEHRGLGTCPDDADGVLGDATPGTVRMNSYADAIEAIIAAHGPAHAVSAEAGRLRAEATMLRAEHEWLADRARTMGIAEYIIAAHGPAFAVAGEVGRLRAEVKQLSARVREWEAVHADLAARCDSGDIPIRLGERYSLAVLREIDRLRDQWRTLATLVEPLGILDADSNDPATLTDRICRWISDLREDSAYQARLLGERQQEIDRLRDVLTQREERLASWDEAAETVATFDRDGTTYEIDHLGIGHPRQWGEYAVYRDGEQVAEFAVPGAGLREEYRPSLPQTDELIELASAALDSTPDTGSTHDQPA